MLSKHLRLARDHGEAAGREGLDAIERCGCPWANARLKASWAWTTVIGMNRSQRTI